MLRLWPAAWLLFGASSASGSSWEKVDPRDPALRAPVVSPGADAEIILWEITVEDGGSWASTQSAISQHVLLKVFNERGRDAQSRVDIPFARGVRVEGVAARTVHPDGSVVELARGAVFDRTIVKAAGLKVKAKSFVFPAAEPGSILEYRYSAVDYGGLTHYVRVDLQQGIPVRRLVLRLKPLVFPDGEFAMRYRSFNVPFPAPVLDASGYATSTMTNVPAFDPEPYMPPEPQARGFVFLYYAKRTQPPVDEYWRECGRQLDDGTSSLRKPGDEVRKAALEAAAGAQAPEERLRRLYAYCRSRIRNVDDDASRVTDDERRNLKENKKPEQTLRRGAGTTWDINFLFASMAAALGLDARVAFLADKSEVLFDPGQELLGLLTQSCVAVRLSSGWSFHSPGESCVAFGRLPWWLEGQDALIPDSREPTFVKTPLTSATESIKRRTAALTLGWDGSVEGDVRIESWGQAAWRAKEDYDEESGTRREEALREEVRAKIPNADVTQVEFRHVDDDTVPCLISYHLRIPDYARPTGSRLFLQPDLFDNGSRPLFTSKDRRYPVAFAYASGEEDSVTYTVPESLEVEAGLSSEPFASPHLGSRRAQLLVAADGRSLCYRRSLRIAEDGTIQVPLSGYPRVREFFDRVHAADAEQILLRSRAAAP